ncbi:MAG: site-specific integrase [Ktedonobacterales bacterium]|nr:site-specific integrase [Ktedonobacterales bacterium]
MARKRGNNEGTIFKRADGRYEARISLPNGKRKSFYGETRQEASDKLNDALQNQRRGLVPMDNRQTIQQFLKFWIEVKTHKLRESTIIRYQAHIKHLNDGIGGVVLSKLTPQKLQVFYNKVIEDGLSPGEVHDMHAVLKSALDYAVEMEHIHANPARKARATSKPRHEMATLNEEQVKIFLDQIRGHRLEALFILAVTTGMRKGELLALHWKEVDFSKKKLSVRYNLQMVTRERGNYRISDTKTSYSRRTIALTATAMRALQERRKAHDEELARNGADWNKEGLVFPRLDGQWMYPSTLRRTHFHPLMRKAGLPLIRFHDLRHTAATLLLGHGVNPKIVSEMLGHSSVSITLDIYSHVMPHMQQIAVETMEGIFAENP